MPATISDCDRRFGHTDFDPIELSDGRCPVRGACHAPLAAVPFRKSTLPWCPEHGIRLHSGTFVYWNGPGREDEARLRNFIVRPDLARTLALAKGMKAESHRLGYEMSEDALTWNVFVSLAMAGTLREVAQWLTGRDVTGEPQLYLWGRRVDLTGGDHEEYDPLCQVRDKLENGIRRFVTEPDIMLVVEGEMLVCIEAKFGSGNPLAHDGIESDGEKPTSVDGLLKRYLGEGATEATRRVVQHGRIGTRLHSQLFRNIVFASEMAGRRQTPWHVVNLVKATERGTRDVGHYAHAEPTDDVRSYLHPDSQHCFTYRTWEQLHGDLIAGDSDLAELDGYLRDKSAHYRPAFELGAPRTQAQATNGGAA